MFAASVVGVFLLSVALEGLRRLSKEYETYAIRQLRALPSKGRPRRATPIQQAIRAFLHALVFAVAYILMLLAMYFNGYIIIAIFVGVGVGKYICDWLVLGDAEADEEYNPTVCCG
jgi:copper transporter 1